MIRPLEGGSAPSEVLMKDIRSTYFEGDGVRSALEEVREGRLQQVGIQGTDIRRWKIAGLTGVAQSVLERLELKGEVTRVPTGLL